MNPTLPPTPIADLAATGTDGAAAAWTWPGLDPGTGLGLLLFALLVVAVAALLRESLARFLQRTLDVVGHAAHLVLQWLYGVAGWLWRLVATLPGWIVGQPALPYLAASPWPGHAAMEALIVLALTLGVAWAEYGLSGLRMGGVLGRTEAGAWVVSSLDVTSAFAILAIPLLLGTVIYLAGDDDPLSPYRRCSAPSRRRYRRIAWVTLPVFIVAAAALAAWGALRVIESTPTGEGDSLGLLGLIDANLLDHVLSILFQGVFMVSGLVAVFLAHPALAEALLWLLWLLLLTGTLLLTVVHFLLQLALTFLCNVPALLLGLWDIPANVGRLLYNWLLRLGLHDRLKLDWLEFVEPAPTLPDELRLQPLLLPGPPLGLGRGHAAD